MPGRLDRYARALSASFDSIIPTLPPREGTWGRELVWMRAVCLGQTSICSPS